MNIKSTADLRSFLIEQMAAVVSGETDASKAKSISNLAQQIYNSLNIEVKMAHARDKVGQDAIVPVELAA
jgi:hypothetical protein